MTLTYRRHARKGIDHLTDGEVYVHHFGTGWQELVFADHAGAARFAAANQLTLVPPRQARDEEVWKAYPPNWPKCTSCTLPAMDGHLTCGRLECDERAAREGALDRWRKGC